MIEPALHEDIATSATPMVPAPATQRCRDLDVDLHLTLAPEYPARRMNGLETNCRIQPFRRRNCRPFQNTIVAERGFHV